jgi:hypothetical protein
MSNAYEPAWLGFHYEVASPHCPHCGSLERFRPPDLWYSLPRQNNLLIRCGSCGLDTIIRVDALMDMLEVAHLERFGYEKKGRDSYRAYTAFVFGAIVGGLGVFLATCH